MGCGDMPHLRKCYCKNSHKSNVKSGAPDLVEFTTFFNVVFWVVFTLILGFAVGLAYIIFFSPPSPIRGIEREPLRVPSGSGEARIRDLPLIEYSFTGEPVRVLNETEETKLRNMPLAEHTFTFQPEKVKTGCEYWFNYISTMDATAEEKDWVQKIVRCESTCNPNAISHMGAIGISQITPPTWQDFGGDRDINNPYHQLEVTLEMYRNGFRQRWCCDQLI